MGNNAGTITNAYATGAVSGTVGNAGGLVGANDTVGTITNSYATGTVHGGGGIGGLVGTNGGTISDAYAIGAVSGSSAIGGLVGYNDQGTIANAFSTGAVSASGGYAGGLVGTASQGSVANSYWNIQTSGQSASAGGTGMTTAQLQGALPSGFGNTLWATGAGLYPYLLWQYPATPQAVSGTAYGAGGGTALNAGSVSVLANGAAEGTVSTGANGYYYELLAPGTISSGGTAVVAYENGGGARVATLTGTTSGFDIWGNTLIAPTSATTYSAASATSLQSQDSALIAQAVGSNTTAASLVAGLTNSGYIASGNFTVDQALTLSNGLYVQAAGNITVADALTLPGANGLTLAAGGALAINAPVSVTGAGAVTLAAGYDTTTVPGTSLLELSFGAGDDINYGSTNNGGSLSINGTAYTLLYTMGDVQNVNSGLNGDYALATPLNAATDSTTPLSWVPLGTDGSSNFLNNGNGFAGIFEGLGNTISNLTVNIGSNFYAGLFGGSSGTIRDIGLIGGSVSGANYVGGLVGFNLGTITNAYATGAVSGGDGIGGLVGLNFFGSITNAYATGAVSGTGIDVGGLAGANLVGGTIANAYATGAVSSTGGYSAVGGLVGSNFSTITNAYATGAVSGTGGYSAVGGLAGTNFGTITNAYATGAVSGTGSDVGGLVGYNDNSGTITNGYWDTQTSGQSAGIGADNNNQSGNVTGQTTALLQGTRPGGFDPAVWGTGTGLFPYFLWQYPSGTPQAISGTAYNAGGGTALDAGSVSVQADGTALGTASTGFNGYYYLLEAPGTINSGNTALIATSSANGARLDTVADALNSANNVSGFDIWGNTLIAPTSATTYSAASATSLQSQDSALIAQAVGSNTTAASLVAGLTNSGYIASGNFTVDQALTLSNGLYVQAAGAITVADALTLPGANGLTLAAGGALAIDAPVSVTGAGAVTLAAGYDTTTVPGTSLLELSFGAGDDINYGSTNNGGSLSINGTGYTLLYTMGDVQNVNSGLNGDYALATPLNATTPPSWVPLGTNGSGHILNNGNGFAGIFEGLGNTISNLTVNIGSNSDAGLFGVSSGTIRDVGLIGGSVGGVNYVGGLAGLNYGTITNAYATGTVSGTGSYVGGLVGFNLGTITNAYATGAVSGTGSYVGGLVGENYLGTITNAYATGAVSGTNFVGGLAGANLGGTIANAYATGAVSGTGSYVGGLAGTNYSGTITNAYATGAVSSFGEGVGGLVGGNFSATITNAYATGAVSGRGDVGGLAGANFSGAIANAYATGAVSGTGSYVGGLLGANGSGTIANSYWNTTTSGQSVGIGADNNNQSGNVTGLTTLQFLTQGPIASGAFSSSDWVAGYPYPVLKALPYLVVDATGTLEYGNTTPLVSVTDITDQNGNTASALVNTAALEFVSGANSQSNVGTYLAGGSGLSAPGYQIAYALTNVSVTPRPLTIDANAQTEEYGTALPALTYTLGGDGLVNNDTLSGALATAAGPTANVGLYAITQGTLAASSNYAVTYTGANVSVTPRPLTIDATPQTEEYGTALPALTYTLGGDGLVNNDTLSGALATTAGPTANVGLYAITQGTLAASSNYAVTYNGANVSVTTRPLTIDANAQTETMAARRPR